MEAAFTCKRNKNRVSTVSTLSGFSFKHQQQLLHPDPGQHAAEWGKKGDKKYVSHLKEQARVVFLLLFWRGNFTAAQALIATDDSVGVALLPLLLKRAGEDGARQETSLLASEASFPT